MANGDGRIEKQVAKNDESSSLGGLGGDLLSQPTRGAEKIANQPEADKVAVKDQAAPTPDVVDSSRIQPELITAKLPESTELRKASLSRSNEGEPNGLGYLTAKNSAGETLVEDWKNTFPNVDANVWKKLEN
jgi:hypothetical protein